MVVQAKAGDLVLAGSTLSVTVGRSQYPEPPAFTRVDSEIVRDLLARYRQCKNGQEPFARMAYAVLTRIEKRAGSRAAAAKRYKISKKVLNRLGDLVSAGKGGPLEVRKFTRDGTDPMSEEDQAWLRKAIPTVIHQVAAVEADLEPGQLTAEKLR